ncbi:unnamed protein product [Lactuca saligna]|uniref:MULE transposase domain-containing protein n=1 Tax=Lactuca saligna TaxID=75948 RepID=A0AA35ZKZ3_LACSI|nr:unnamed protein product [Lactuca saligna]
MASSSGTKKLKGPEKVYVRDEDSDDDLIGFSFLDFAPETFKPSSNLSDDPFLNILCDENKLRRNLDGMGDDDQDAGVKDLEHDHIDDQNDSEVGVEYKVHDPDIQWKQMKPVVGECYESPSQLRMFSLNVSKGQCHRARTKAKQMIEGKLEEDYANVWDYAAEILRSNPGSTFKIKGELLTAVGRDAYNHVYPIAWAVIDVEKKDNWTWFIELLVADLGLDCGRGLVVISDQHKDLLQAVTELLPYVEHKQCARHIYANFRKKYTGISQNVTGVDEAVLTCLQKLEHEDFETIKDLQASGYDHGEIVEAFNKLTKERKEMLVESIVDEETSQETQDPLVKKRMPLERIIKIKLKKAVHDPDGGGSTTKKALTLD